MGVRAPRLHAVPAYERTYGPDVVELAAMAGLVLDPWQCDALDDMCAVAPDRPGEWNTLECGLVVPRQNGKGGILEAYTLACLFLFDDETIMFSAHRFDTAQKMFRRIAKLVAGAPSLKRRVRQVYEGNGKESILLKSGAELKFHARSDAAARGFSGDKAILDEAFKLDPGMMGAILPALSARPNPQIVYASSAGWEISVQLGTLRRRALATLHHAHRANGATIEESADLLGVPLEDAERLEKKPGADPSLAWLEWSVPETTQRTKAAMNNPALFAQANPALGIRLTERFCAAELRTLGAIEFARERLGIGDYPPDSEDDGWTVISEVAWAKLTHPDPEVRPGAVGGRRPAFAVDMRPDRSKACIAAAYEDDEGNPVVEVIAHAQGSGWVVARLLELRDRYDPCAIAFDTVGPGSSLIEELKNRDVDVLELSTADIAQAYGQFIDAATDTRTLRHHDQEPLNDAIKGATTRPLGVRKTWDRTGDTDICPLVAATNALHAHIRTAHLATDPMENIW
jgi:hypothetical protein